MAISRRAASSPGAAARPAAHRRSAGCAHPGVGLVWTCPMPTTRDQALVLVASTDSDLVDRVTESVRSTGAATCRAGSTAGCLRVATAVGPDVVLLDARFSPKLERLLRAHPATARSDIVRLHEHVAQQHRMECP